MESQDSGYLDVLCLLRLLREELVAREGEDLEAPLVKLLVECLEFGVPADCLASEARHIQNQADLALQLAERDSILLMMRLFSAA